MKKTKFRPSNSERLLNCNLSLWLPEKQKTEEQERYLAERSEDHKRLSQGIFDVHEQNCKDYYKFVLEKCDGVFVEETLSTFLEGDCFEGTPDLFGYDEMNHCLYIIDYKTGFRHVNAWENSQLLSYAALILLVKKEWEIDHFKLSILNTKSDLCSHYGPRKETIVNHVERIQQSYNFMKKGTAYGVTGDWCVFCPSRSYCPLQRDITETKELMDSHVDELIFAKETRGSEIRSRMKELRETKAESNVFEYEIHPNKKLRIISPKGEC